MDYSATAQQCHDLVDPLYEASFSFLNVNVNLTSENVALLSDACYQLEIYEVQSYMEDEYSAPMVLIGMYISVASLFCTLAMALDLLSGLRARKFWFPTKYFSLNAASITVIAVAMKLPVDLTSPMPGYVEQAAKLGGLGFMCTMMSNFMPSLASMDNKSLLANVTGLSILVITVIVNILIQLRTHLIGYSIQSIGLIIIACSYIGMLLILLIILISSAITLPTSKNYLEFKFQDLRKKDLRDQNSQENLIVRLRQVVKRYWIMAETGSPQFVMASSPLSSASGIICASSMLINTISLWSFAIGPYIVWHYYDRKGILSEECTYKWSIIVIAITQSIGTVVGSIAPVFRCFTVYRFKSFANQKRDHFSVFKVEKYWTKKLCEWKESRISFLSRSRRSRVLLHSLKTLILSFCIVLQKIVVVSCKIIGLIPIVVILFAVYCSSCFKSVKAMLFTPPTTASIDDHGHEDLSDYLLLLEDNMRIAKRTMKGILDSMNRFIKKAEKKQHNNLLKLLEKSVAPFNGVVTFDIDQVQSLLSVQHVNTWSLSVISLTCIAIALPNISNDMVDNLVNSVNEGLLFTHIVEECLNMESVYVNVRRATKSLWLETEDDYKWLGTNLQSCAYKEMMPIEILKKFAHMAEKILNEFKSNGEPMEIGNLPTNIIVANSMYRIAQTIIHTYESKDLNITEKELFTRLSDMIADILAACLTNIPRVIEMRCQESVIEKREASVKAAVDLLGRTTHIIKILETRVLPNMDPDKMGFIDEWRLHLKQP